MALLLISLFLFFAVFLRIAVQWYRTNDLGLRAASLNAPLMEIFPGTIFVLSFCVALVISALAFLEMLSPIVVLPNLIRWLFFAVGLIGITTAVISQNQMGDSWRIGVDQQETTDLKTNGLYARSRNPIYFGILLFWIGLCGTFVQPILLASAAVCWICIELIVRKIEEPYLVRIHGDAFTQYAKRTKRYSLI